MSTPLKTGDALDVLVTAVKPFGVLVRTDTGIPGLVRNANAEVGATVRVQVVDYDPAQSRFSATLA